MPSNNINENYVMKNTCYYNLLLGNGIKKILIANDILNGIIVEVLHRS